MTHPSYQLGPVRLACLLAVLSSWPTGGCGGPATYEVQGQVVFPNGSSFGGGRVELELDHPELDKRVNAQGEIAADGTFQLKARQGTHRVIVVPPLGSPTGLENTGAKQLLHPRFRSYQETPLKIEVSADETKNRFKLVVEK